MPDLLLELLSEEIPARMQGGAARALERLARERLTDAGLGFDTLSAFAGPRRLTLLVEGLPAAQPARTSERRGPRLNAPAAAVEGFLRGAGAAREALYEKDGAWHLLQESGGGPTKDVLAPMLAGMLASFPWPKSMVWGDGEARWVRPLRRILCVFERRIVPFGFAKIESGDLSEGHRTMSEARVFRARDFDEYREALAGRRVVLAADERKRRILAGAEALCAARGLRLAPDPGLLEEVAGMVEWPTPIIGDFDRRFLDLPAEVVRTSMRTHQRYFAVERDGALAPHFVAVANIEATDGGRLIAAGNARVLDARLDDARFFWEEDRKVTLEARLEKLKGVVFQERLGTMYERALRLEAAARAVAPLARADPFAAGLAGRLAKADLATAMVGEFPELQGVMGGHYALAEGLAADVALAITEHYKPQGPNDSPPSRPVSVAVALADKIDTIVGFFSIGEKPTGSKDPYALRRAALGVIRVLLETRTRAPIRALAAICGASEAEQAAVLAFFVDRLDVLLRERGLRHDLIDAVFASGDDDVVRLADRVSALADLLETETGANLLAGYRRAGNILSAEEKKGPLPKGAPRNPNPGAPQERALRSADAEIKAMVEDRMAAEDFTGAMRTLADLRAPVDDFFEQVLVNSDVEDERSDRLRLLAQVRSTMEMVADFSRISG